MKFAVIALALFVVVQAASEAGQFVPRSVYTLDSEGHQSAVHPVSARLLRRLRRQVYTSSSSSSSSSSTSNGNGGFFSQSTQSVQNPDGTSHFGAVVQQFAVPAPNVDLQSRFGEDSPTSNTASAVPQGSILSYTETKGADGKIKQHVHQIDTDKKGQWVHRESHN